MTNSHQREHELSLLSRDFIAAVDIMDIERASVAFLDLYKNVDTDYTLDPEGSFTEAVFCIQHSHVDFSNDCDFLDATELPLSPLEEAVIERMAEELLEDCLFPQVNCFKTTPLTHPSPHLLH